ncbi:MAG: hypothetical protein HZB26_08675 [Candidatus Hydrogenedentes bacterium]|nr:hypothetical protein [Candidatus Hydrogenedentota bacterium]
MGVVSLQPLASVFPGQSKGLFSDLTNLPALRTLQSTAPPVDLAKAAQTPSANTTTPDPTSDLGSQFDSVVYSSQMARVSLAARFQEVAARIAQSQGDSQGQQQSVEVGVQQLEFSFFAEVKAEQMASFHQRTTAVADGLSGTQQQTYIEASQRVAARFSMSINISGAALTGFAGASEGIKGAGQDNLDKQLLDKFLGVAEDALKSADEIFNQIFELFNGFVNGGGGGANFQAQFNQLLDKLQKIDFSGLFGPANASSGAPNSGKNVQVQAFGMSIQMEFEFVSSSEVVVQQSDPITLDLNGNGIDLTSYLNGARFDITGSGQLVNTAFVNGGDAFLALDRNGNGAIDSGKELFGDQNGAKNGYEELRKLDTNGDGVIDAADRDFNKLALFKDNGNGKTEAGELLSLQQAGITEISLSYRSVSLGARGGNHIGQVGSYTTVAGKKGLAADSILNYTA